MITALAGIVFAGQRRPGTPQIELTHAINIAAFAFVGVLFVVSSPDDNRNAASVIRRRLLAVGAVTAFGVCTMAGVYLLDGGELRRSRTNDEGTAATAASLTGFLAWLGVRTEHCLLAALLPLFLSVALFTGPLVVDFCRRTPAQVLAAMKQSFAANPSAKNNSSVRLQTLRDLVFAPLFEEIVFRGCVCTLLLGSGWSFGVVVLCSPLLFGLAHMHHVLYKVRVLHMPLKRALLQLMGVLAYTSLFGMFASFCYLRTGHLIAAILPHMFCNMMGAPTDLGWWHDKSDALHGIRWFLLGAFFAGITLFTMLLYPLTSPEILFARTA
jgi:prenyl protein peptidase